MAALTRLSNRHDHEHLSGILSIVPRGGWCIEAGAHRGIWTRRLVEHFDAVFAFEPHPDLYRELCRDVPRASAFNLALGDELRKCSLVAGTDNDGQYAVTLDNPEDVPAYMVTLDMQDWVMPITFIKLDVEGFELAVLRGGEQTIQSHRPYVMIEQNGLEKEYGFPIGAAGELLREWGMKEVGRWNKDHLFGW